MLFPGWMGGVTEDETFLKTDVAGHSLSTVTAGEKVDFRFGFHCFGLHVTSTSLALVRIYQNESAQLE